MDLRKKGLTLAKIAYELGQSISWVNARLKIEYAPKGGREGEFESIEKDIKPSVDRKEVIETLLKKLSDEKKIIGEELVKIDEEINCPVGRSDEELVEYRKRRDKEAQIADAVPKFDND